MSSLEKQRKLFIMSSLAIPVFLLVCFVVFPAIDLFRMSFTNWDGLSKTSDFIMFDNYVSMFKNPDLWQSLKNNAVYFVVHLCMIPIELAFAVLLTSKLRAAKFYKTMVFLPYIINGVAISYAFSYFFSPSTAPLTASWRPSSWGCSAATAGCPTRRSSTLPWPLSLCGGSRATISSCLWPPYSR